ncbi:ATP-binding cassette domain-containing protein [Spirillospora sp. NPDC127200]
MTAVHTQDLRRHYGPVEAVRGLDLRVDSGEMFGFLGPNGAGKSTTVAMLCTLLRPTSGRARVAGADLLDEPALVRERIGVVFQESTGDPDLTAEENLRFHAELYGLTRRRARRAAAELLELFGLAGHGRRRVAAFSGGMRRRLEIARSLVHRPRVLFLDEPTAGLDPQSRAALWEHLHRLRREHAVTVFLTTHHLEESENCDRLCVIDHGRIVTQGSPRRLKAEIGSDVVRLRTGDDAAAARAVRRDLGLAASATPDGVHVPAADGAALVPRLCARLPVEVHAVTVTTPTLDEVFLHHTGRPARDKEPT